MKGYLHKIEEWFVVYDQRTMQDPSAEDGMLPLHPNDVAISSFSFYNGKEVEFEIMQYDGTIPILNAWNGYAKLIDKFDVLKEMFELEGQLVDSYPISEENKHHSFCETPKEKCTMSYCDENGCINRKRNLVTELPLQTDENGKQLKYWGGLKDRTCTNSCSVVCGECQILHISDDCEEVRNWDSFVEQKNKELYYQKQVMNPYSSDLQSYTAYEKGFIEGFEKAKETLYTEEQVREAFHIGRLYQGREGDTNIQQYLQSLKQLKKD